MMTRIKPIFKEASLVLLRLTNSVGTYIDILNRGASLVSVVVPDRNGGFRNVVLRYDKITDYFTDSYYLGSTVGRVANRISRAAFHLDGRVYKVEKNDGLHSNHGGFSGLNSKIFDYDIRGNEVIFHTESHDGEGGYPGNLKLEISYFLSDNNEIIICFKAKTDKKTPLSLTNHAYFNLSGEADVLTHKLKIESDKFLEMKDDFIPSGRTLSVKEYPAYCFDGKSTIGEMMERKSEHIKGYNAYFITNGNQSHLKKIATLSNELSGISMNLLTTFPGCMFYTGDYLSNPFVPFSGLCIEAQYYPDAPNHIHFPNIFLVPEEIWEEMIVYAFIN